MPRPLRSALSTFIAALIGTIGACVLATFITAAQESTACDQAAYEAIATALDDYAAQLRDTAGDPDTALRELRDYASIQVAACTGLSFDSDTEGAQPLIGPIEIPEGLYRATFTSEGNGIIGFEAIDGECEADRGGNMFAVIRDGEASGGVESLVTSEGCTALLKFDSTSDPWALTFEKIR